MSSPHGKVGREMASGDSISPSDGVNHPAHYGGENSAYEAIKVIWAWNADFYLGSALKYLARAGRKPGEDLIKDLRKAEFYLRYAIENPPVPRMGHAMHVRPEILHANDAGFSDRSEWRADAVADAWGITHPSLRRCLTELWKGQYVLAVVHLKDRIQEG